MQVSRFDGCDHFVPELGNVHLSPDVAVGWSLRLPPDITDGLPGCEIRGGLDVHTKEIQLSTEVGWNSVDQGCTVNSWGLRAHKTAQGSWIGGSSKLYTSLYFIAKNVKI